MGAADAACGCATTHRAGTGRRRPWWRPCASMACTRRPSSTARSTIPPSSPTSSRSSRRRCGRATSSCSTTCAAQAARGPSRHRTRRRAAPLSAALQSRLQSDRDGLRQTQGLAPCRAPADLRPGHRARETRAAALHPDRMPELHSALRLSLGYVVVKNALGCLYMRDFSVRFGIADGLLGRRRAHGAFV